MKQRFLTFTAFPQPCLPPPLERLAAPPLPASIHQLLLASHGVPARHRPVLTVLLHRLRHGGRRSLDDFTDKATGIAGGTSLSRVQREQRSLIASLRSPPRRSLCGRDEEGMRFTPCESRCKFLLLCPASPSALAGDCMFTAPLFGSLWKS